LKVPRPYFSFQNFHWQTTEFLRNLWTVSLGTRPQKVRQPWYRTKECEVRRSQQSSVGNRYYNSQFHMPLCRNRYFEL